MEKTEKDMKEFNEKEMEPSEVRQELQNENGQAKSAADMPMKGKLSLKRVIIGLFVTVGIAVPVIMLFIHKQHEEEYYDYEYGEEPSDGYVVYSGGSSDIVNPDTKEVIVKDIDWCHYSDGNDEPPIVLFAKNGKRGYCNIATGEVIVEPTTYTKAWIFSEGLAAVEKNGYIGFVNTSGKVAIDFKYSYRGNDLYAFVFHDGHCVVADSSNKIGVINTKGRWVIKPKYDHVEITKDYAVVYNDGEFKKQVDFQGNVLQDGIIDDINELYYNMQYTNLQTGEPQEGYAKNNDYYEYQVGYYSGLIDSKGKIITPPIYTDISGITPTLFRACLKDNLSIVIIDTKGNVVSTTGK